jgi:large subunit ribosomal protein L6
MSRIGKKPITIPAGVTVAVDGKIVTVKGPLGELSRSFPFSGISVAVSGSEVLVTMTKENNENKAFWGTTAAHIKNMVAGVVKAYEKKLIVEGIGYKWDVKGTDIVMSVGFSHQVKVSIPKGVKIVIDNKGLLTVSGISKDAVGEFASKIRSVKEPEPYKGKGIRYDTEVIRRKQGKKTV